MHINMQVFQLLVGLFLAYMELSLLGIFKALLLKPQFEVPVTVRK